jgi:beta-galactosidase
MPRNSHLKWTVNYEPGKLEAVAYRNNKKLTTSVITTNEAVELVLESSKNIMLANGKDVVVVNIGVKDKNGLLVPTANNLIEFSIDGDAEIIGVGNGDPSSHEADKCIPGKWQRSLFNGRAQVILQSGKTESAIRLSAKAVDLKSSVIHIQQKNLVE